VKRIQIAYGVDLPDFAKELVNMISLLEYSLNIQETIKEISSNISKEDFLSALSKIDLARKKMVKIDMRLEDISMILQGYVQKVQPEIEEDTTEEQKENKDVNAYVDNL